MNTTPQGPRSDSGLEALLRLYRPNVGGGNYQADVFARGANAMLRQAAVVLGLATEGEIDREFRRLDDESTKRIEAAVARANARVDAQGQEQAPEDER